MGLIRRDVGLAPGGDGSGWYLGDLKPGLADQRVDAILHVLELLDQARNRSS
jgi:hypothetical protein